MVVLGMWERWTPAERTERRLWKSTLTAFGVANWAMCDVRGGPFTSPHQWHELGAMLEAHPGPKTFLIPPHTAEAAGLSFVELGDYTHPSDAIYVFGNGAENLVRWVTSDDEVVSIRTPSRADLFAAVVVGVVLHDRAVKQ